MNQSLVEHCSEINRCNQRGGRMLSIVDLIDAGTISRDLAAYCLSAIGGGASFMVGAVPGGGGKTTVMGALLNFAPADVFLRPADGIEAIRRGRVEPDPRCCYICHEIGRGPYYAYLWGAALRAYFELPESGHILATNLHADTLEEVRQQLCRDNAVSPTALRRMNLLLFLTVRRRKFQVRREIAAVWESDGRGEHRLLFQEGRTPFRPAESQLVADEEFVAARELIEAIMTRGDRTIEEVRAAVLA